QLAPQVEINQKLEESHNLELIESILDEIKSTIIKEVNKKLKSKNKIKNNILQHKFRTTFNINIQKNKTVTIKKVVTNKLKSESDTFRIYMDIKDNHIEIDALWWKYCKKQGASDVADELVDLFIYYNNPRLVSYLLGKK
ncbi:hypothetical protein, partial [Bacillus toyonensis]